jgi:hypothetical protein
MTRAGAVTGRVIDPSGVADADDVVCLRGNGVKLELLTDDRGAFRFHTLRDGPYKVWVAGEDESNARPVTVVGGRTEDLLIAVPWSLADRIPSTEAVAEPREEPLPAGALAIRGRVISADTGLPLENIVVRVAGSVQTTTRTTASGRFTFPVPAGGYLVTATGTPKYVGLSYGQKAQFDPPTSVIVAPDHPIADVTLALPEMKVLTGRIVDEFGEPAPDVTVASVQSVLAAGKVRFLPFARGGLSQDIVTDDLGEFRLRNVAPGTMFLMALSGPFANVTGSPSGPVLRGYGYAVTFFPGTAIPGSAQPIVVDARGVPPPVSFAMAPAEMGTVAGRIVDRSGEPTKLANVMLMQLHAGDLRMLVPAYATPDSNGVFSIENVPAGTYVAQGLGNGFASEIITVSPRQTAQVELRLNPPSAIRGRLVFDGGAAAPAPNQIQIRPVSTDFVRGPAGGIVQMAAIREDGTFGIPQLTGFNVLLIDVPAPWMVVSVSAGGVDMTDRPFDSSAGDVDGVIVRFAPQTTTFACKVSDRTGQPLSNGFVLIVPQDSTKWAYPSRGVRGLRTDTNGSCSTSGLPPGTYRAVPFDRAPRADWMNPDYLQTIQGLGEGFTIGIGETITLRLEIRK